MKFLIQKVKEASVSVNNNIVGSIGKGLLVFVGINTTDTKEDADYLINKLLKLRLFEEEEKNFHLSINDINAELLIVSQFTLYANCTKGNRPSFDDAAKSENAIKLYTYIIQSLKEKNKKVETGIFGEYMQVNLINDGPTTILIEKQKN